MPEKTHVSGEWYEELKMLCATGEVCALQFRAENGGIVTTETTVADVFEDGHGQYLLAGNGLCLQLHQLIAVNGKPVAPWC